MTTIKKIGFIVLLSVLVTILWCPPVQTQSRPTMRLFEARNPKNTIEVITPLAAQDEARFSESLITALLAGWGYGKTTGAVLWAETSMNCNPGCRGLVLEPEYKMLREFINYKFKPAFREYIIGESKQDNTIFLERGIEVVYLSGHNIDKLEQYEAAWLLADEFGLISSDLLTRAVARTRDPSARRRRIGLFGTPHWGPWAEKLEGKDDSHIKTIHASTNDNPYTGEDFKRDLYESCPAHLVQAYINGYFVPPGGLVYPEYDELRNVSPWAHNPSLPTGIAIDWSPRNPHVLFLQQLPRGYVLPSGTKLDRDGAIVFDELHPRGDFAAIRTDDLCRQALDKGYKLNFACGDPAGVSVEASSGLDQMHIAKGVLGMNIKFTRNPRLRSVKNGIEHVARMLSPMTGNPSLFFAEKLARKKDARAVCRAIKAYSYPKSKEGKPLDDEPEKDGISDHAMDALRYYVVNFHPVLRLQTRVRQYA